MTFHRHTSRTRGSFLLEVLLCVSLIALVCAGLLVAIKPTWSDVDSSWGPKNAAALNLAMSAYRGYVAKGYAPSSAWSATNAAGVLAELAKPLQRGGVSVVVMSGAPQVDLSIGNVTPSSFTANAVWTSN